MKGLVSRGTYISWIELMIWLASADFLVFIMSICLGPEKSPERKCTYDSRSANT